MTVQIHPVRFGVVKGYLIRGKKSILVDAGAPGGSGAFSSALEKARVRPEEIRLVVLTHGHMDHMGSAKNIKALTGAPLAIHQRDQISLETGEAPVPPGTTVFGKVMSFLGRRLSNVRVPPVPADILLGDDDFPLTPYGIQGKVIYTPGHTIGSVSVVLEDGSAFVGDLAMNRFMRLRPGPPIFAHDLELVMESWAKVLVCGAQTIYPAHGKPFSADVFRAAVG